MALPGPALPGEEQLSARREAFRHADLTVEELWLRYFALGGDADLVAVDAHVNGLLSLPPEQGDMVALAINERLDELVAQRRAPYSRALRHDRTVTGPLAALVHLL